MPGKIEYFSGQKIHDVFFVEEIFEVDKDRKAKFLCFCGKEFVAYIHSVKSNITKSCGCYRRNYMRCKKTKHGLSRHPLYNTYNNMIERCYSKSNNSYSEYGGNGVVVCKEWLSSFMSFYNWSINNGWQDGLQLDKDIKGNGKLYSPKTCCFVTPKDNSNKRKTSRFIEINGDVRTLSQWSEYSGVKRCTISARIKAGWSVEKSIFHQIVNKSHE